MLKIYEQAKQKVPFSILFFSYCYPTCAGNGNRIIKAKLKTFTHHRKSEWQKESCERMGRTQRERETDAHTHEADKKTVCQRLKAGQPHCHSFFT